MLEIHQVALELPDAIDLAAEFLSFKCAQNQMFADLFVKATKTDSKNQPMSGNETVHKIFQRDFFASSAPPWKTTTLWNSVCSELDRALYAAPSASKGGSANQTFLP